jgi:hypothetical protein
MRGAGAPQRRGRRADHPLETAAHALGVAEAAVACDPLDRGRAGLARARGCLLAMQAERIGLAQARLAAAAAALP